jgi:phosphoribosylformylglycinamidine cyclo-ligase
VHSNGLTLARRVLLDEAGLALDARPEALGGATVADVLLEPTVIYVRAILKLLRSDVPVHGLAHITGGGLLNLLRLGEGVGFEISQPLPVCPVFSAIAELGNVTAAEMWEVFNMGCGFCCVVASGDVQDALDALTSGVPDARRIGRVRDGSGVSTLPA